MALKRLDHVNMRTAQLDEMVRFYRDVLGLESGERPPFPFGGSWLYCDGHPVVHLVEVDEPPQTADPRLEHFAFEAEGLADFLTKLRAYKVAYWVAVVPGFETRQVNFRDPDHNHIHVDFQPHEEADLSAYPG